MAGAFKSGGLAQLPVLEFHKGQPHVLAATGKAEAGHGDYPLHRFLLIFHEMLFQLPDDLDSPFRRGPGRQLDLADDEPLVLIRQEGGGQPQEEEDHGANQGGRTPPGSGPVGRRSDRLCLHTCS